MKYLFIFIILLVSITACSEGDTTSETSSAVQGGRSTSIDGQNITYDPDLIRDGEDLFKTTCSACHGSDAKGISGLGKDLVHNDFINSLNDPKLRDFIVTGRSAWDKANTTGVDMPPKGGNPSLSDQQIDAIVAYLRSLQ